MKTVVLCGSMRFSDQMQKTALDLELHRGFNVLQCVYNPDGISLSPDDVCALETAHRRKIELADAVYVINIDGYIGESVKKEISFARSLGKEIIFHCAQNIPSGSTAK